jgi:hypothetical protein
MLMEFVASLSKPRHRFLTGLQIVHDNAYYCLRHQWENEGLLISATDGSATEDGTFGWVLALPDGTALVKCNSPADGAPNQMSSGRAETAGVPVLAHFFHAAKAYLETIPTGHCRNYIDSKGPANPSNLYVHGYPLTWTSSRISDTLDR